MNYGNNHTENMLSFALSKRDDSKLSGAVPVLRPLQPTWKRNFAYRAEELIQMEINRYCICN